VPPGLPPACPQSSSESACAWHGPDHALDNDRTADRTVVARLESTNQPTANVGPDDRRATGFRTGFRTARVTFRCPQIMREGRENTASNGPRGREKACGMWPGIWAGSLPASPAAVGGQLPRAACARANRSMCRGRPASRDDRSSPGHAGHPPPRHGTIAARPCLPGGGEDAGRSLEVKGIAVNHGEQEWIDIRTGPRFGTAAGRHRRCRARSDKPLRMLGNFAPTAQAPAHLPTVRGTFRVPLMPRRGSPTPARRSDRRARSAPPRRRP